MVTESVREMSFRMARYDRNMRRELVRVRQERGLTQKDVAKRLGTTVRWVKRIESYDSDPRMSEMRRYKCSIYAELEEEA